MSAAQKSEFKRGAYDIGLFQEWCENTDSFYDRNEYQQCSTWALKRTLSRKLCGTVVLIDRKILGKNAKDFHFLSPDTESIIGTPKSMTAVYLEI